MGRLSWTVTDAKPPSCLFIPVSGSVDGAYSHSVAGNLFGDDCPLTFGFFNVVFCLAFRRTELVHLLCLLFLSRPAICDSVLSMAVSERGVGAAILLLPSRSCNAFSCETYT